MSAVLIVAAGLLAGPAPSDTTFTIPSGATVVIDNAEGDIEIRGRRGREGRALADGRDGRVAVERRGSGFHIFPDYYREDDGSDLLLTLPPDVLVEVHGGSGDITVSGMERAVTIHTLDGDITVIGGGPVTVNSADGDVVIRRARGPIVANTGDGDVRIESPAGPITVQGIDGDVLILDASSAAVSVSTVDGDLRYDGTVESGGDYALATHDGSVTFALPRGAGARVTVRTFDGSLIPSFPIELRGTVGSIAEFSLGDGSARVRLETFDGDIYLLRPGENVPGDGERGAADAAVHAGTRTRGDS